MAGVAATVRKYGRPCGLFDTSGHLLVQGNMNDTEVPQKNIPFCSSAPCISVPWSEDFENGSGGWTQDPWDNSDRTRSNAIITSSQGSDHTTGSGYSYPLRGGVTVQRRALLRSPRIDLNGGDGPGSLLLVHDPPGQW